MRQRQPPPAFRNSPTSHVTTSNPQASSRRPTRTGVAGMITGTAFALLLHVTLVVLALTAVARGIEWLCDRAPRLALALAVVMALVAAVVVAVSWSGLSW